VTARPNNLAHARTGRTRANFIKTAIRNGNDFHLTPLKPVADGGRGLAGLDQKRHRKRVRFGQGRLDETRAHGDDANSLAVESNPETFEHRDLRGLGRAVRFGTAPATPEPRPRRTS
jgi:hypothetical protein